MWNFIKNLFKRKASGVKMPKHFEIAKKEIGVKEVKNGENPRIIEYHTATDLKATEDEISWCAAFINWCLREAGSQGTNKANARSFLRWGKKVETPEIGDVVIFWRGSRDSWKGHVAFYAGENEDSIRCLGGNQSDSVCYRWMKKSQVLDYRRLS